MAELPISEWIAVIHQTIHETLNVIAPLEWLGKHVWARQLMDQVRMMRKAIDSLQRLGAHHKRAGRPPH